MACLQQCGRFNGRRSTIARRTYAGALGIAMLGIVATVHANGPEHTFDLSGGSVAGPVASVTLERARYWHDDDDTWREGERELIATSRYSVDGKLLARTQYLSGETRHDSYRYEGQRIERTERRNSQVSTIVSMANDGNGVTVRMESREPNRPSRPLFTRTAEAGAYEQVVFDHRGTPAFTDRVSVYLDGQFVRGLDRHTPRFAGRAARRDGRGRVVESLAYYYPTERDGLPPAIGEFLSVDRTRCQGNAAGGLVCSNGRTVDRHGNLVQAIVSSDLQRVWTHRWIYRYDAHSNWTRAEERYALGDDPLVPWQVYYRTLRYH